jgi:dihydroorotase
VFAGTDSAPHPESKKLSSGAFGVFSAPLAVELYTQIFDELGALDALENFLSINGPHFYNLQPSNETITIEKKDGNIMDSVITDEGDKILPLCADETIHWKLRADS